MAKKKYKMGAQLGTGAAAAIASAGAGYAAGEVMNLEPGVKRAGVSALVALLVAGGMYAFDETRNLAMSAGIGGLVGAAGMMIEPKVREMIADRRAARELAGVEEQQAFEDSFSYPPPQMPTVSAPLQPIVVNEAPKLRAPTERELWMGTLNTFVEGSFDFLGDAFGGSSFGLGSSGMNFGYGAGGMDYGETMYLAAEAAA